MPRFSYVSRDAHGQRVTAIAEAESRQNLLTQLKGQGFAVIELKELKAAARGVTAARRKRPRRWAPARAVRTADMALFWREIAAMIHAGLPVVDALNSILEELEHERLHRVVSDVVAHMWEGFNFSQSLARHPSVFSPMTQALIASAEESGNLPKIAHQLADYFENRDRLFRKVATALSYPLFVCAFFLVILTAATFWIIPMFRDIYEGFGTRLPWLTETVFRINEITLRWFPWMTAGGAAALLALVLWVRKPSGRVVVDRITLKIPVFGQLLRLAALARFCRSLATLMEGGIPISRALEMARETTGNTVISRAVGRCREEILEGSRIAASFKKQGIFPPMMVRMMATGEETGSLSGLLDGVADFYESRVDAALATINSLIEPILIITIGILVLIFVLAMYLPIFSLGRSMR